MNALVVTQGVACVHDERRITDGVFIDTNTQQLFFYRMGNCVWKATVSTAKNGTGQKMNSGCTPLGLHRIAAKIGEGAPKNTVFVGRVATGEIYDQALADSYPQRDWILTRILWLEGLVHGYNKGIDAQGDNCDTYQRYIYIHGTPDSEMMGVPLSHGCIRMRHEDLLTLFDMVQLDTQVQIV